MLVPLPPQQNELFLRKGRVDKREGKAMERQVPHRVPGVLPRIWHRDDVGVVEVSPTVVSAILTALRWSIGVRITIEPHVDIEVIPLLGVGKTGESLTNDLPSILRCVLGVDVFVKVIGLDTTLLDNAGDFVDWASFGGEPKMDRDRVSSGNFELVPHRCFRALLFRIHGGGARNDVTVDSVLRIRSCRLLAVHEGTVGLVLAEQRSSTIRHGQAQVALAFLIEQQAAIVFDADRWLWRLASTPAPSVAEPNCWQDVKRVGFG